LIEKKNMRWISERVIWFLAR